MTDISFSSAFAGVDNAKRHLADFEAKLTAFIHSNPYTEVLEHNANGTEDFYKVRLTKALPGELADIAFDCISNLRAALDRAAYAVAMLADPEGKGQNTYFPFGNDLVNAQGHAKGHSREIPKEIFDLMIAFKPYKGGNDLLWALNVAANVNKHRILAPVTLAAVGMRGHNIGGDPTNVRMNHFLTNRWPPRWDSAKNEMTVFHVARGVNPGMYVEISVQVTMAEIEVIGGQPAFAILNEFVRITESIVMGIEAEARRLRLIH